MQTIKGENFIARYDDEKNIIYAIFGVEATGETTSLLYMALNRLLRDVELSRIQGMEFDLRRVDAFTRDTVPAMQQESFRLNKKYDMSRVPVAFVVNSAVQEQMANFVIQITPDKDRSEIVYSTAEAKAYFVDWHDYHSART